MVPMMKNCLPLEEKFSDSQPVQNASLGGIRTKTNFMACAM